MEAPRLATRVYIFIFLAATVAMLCATPGRAENSPALEVQNYGLALGTKLESLFRSVSFPNTVGTMPMASSTAGKESAEKLMTELFEFHRQVETFFINNITSNESRDPTEQKFHKKIILTLYFSNVIEFLQVYNLLSLSETPSFYERFCLRLPVEDNDNVNLGELDSAIVNLYLAEPAPNFHGSKVPSSGSGRPHYCEPS